MQGVARLLVGAEMMKRYFSYGLIGVFALMAIALGANAGIRDRLGLIVGLVYSDLTKPNDPLTRTLRGGGKAGSGWGSAVQLIPIPLTRGEARHDVDLVLAKGKYTADRQRNFSWHSPREFPAGSLFYAKHVDGAPCSLTYEVVVTYDDNGRLLDAVGNQEEAGCL